MKELKLTLCETNDVSCLISQIQRSLNDLKFKKLISEEKYLKLRIKLRISEDIVNEVYVDLAKSIENIKKDTGCS